MPTKYLSSKDASKKTNGRISESGITRLARNEKIQGAKKDTKGRWLIPEDEFSLYLRENRIPTDPNFLSRFLGWITSLKKTALAIILIGLVTFIGWLLSTVANLTAVSESYKERFPPRPAVARENEILIIVSEFVGKGDYNPTKRIYDELTGKIHLENVRIDMAPDAPDTRVEAFDVLGKYKASIIIWGTFDDAGITPSYQIKNLGHKLVHPEFQMPEEQTFEEYRTYIRKGLPADYLVLANLILGQIYIYKDMNAEAEQVFTSVIDASQDISAIPSDISIGIAYYDRGFARQRMGKVQEANVDIITGTSMYQSPEMLFGLGISYAEVAEHSTDEDIKQKNFELAVDTYDDALSLGASISGSVSSEWEAQVLFMRGYAEYERRNLRVAKDNFTEALSKNPEHYLALHWRGVVNAEACLFEEARSDFERFEELTKDFKNQDDVFIVSARDWLLILDRVDADAELRDLWLEKCEPLL